MQRFAQERDYGDFFGVIVYWIAEEEDGIYIKFHEAATGEGYPFCLIRDEDCDEILDDHVAGRYIFAKTYTAKYLSETPLSLIPQ
jgi:hypothetical protein